jgi:CheY-like chemotaxis protein
VQRAANKARIPIVGVCPRPPRTQPGTDESSRPARDKAFQITQKGYRQSRSRRSNSSDFKPESRAAWAHPMREPTLLSRQLHQTMPADDPGPPRRDVRVLIVDDSGSFRVAARELLEHRGYLVIGEASSAAEAIEAIDNQPPDAVLLDVRLRDESGGVVAAYVRARYPAVAVLLVSADAGEAGRRLDGNVTGAFGPVDKSDLAKLDLTKYWPAPPGRDR